MWEGNGPHLSASSSTRYCTALRFRSFLSIKDLSRSGVATNTSTLSNSLVCVALVSRDGLEQKREEKRKGRRVGNEVRTCETERCGETNGTENREGKGDRGDVRGRDAGCRNRLAIEVS